MTFRKLGCFFSNLPPQTRTLPSLDPPLAPGSALPGVWVWLRACKCFQKVSVSFYSPLPNAQGGKKDFIISVPIDLTSGPIVTA